MHRPVGLADHRQQPAAALTVGAGPGLHLPRRPVVRRVAGRAPRAPVGDRAGRAPRLGGGADQRAELHHRDRPGGRGLGVVGQDALGQVALGPGHRRGRELDAGERPREHPAHVGVQHDVPPPVGERRDRGRGVVADARQREQVVVARRHLAAVLLDDRDGRGVQPQRPARVAEPSPGAHRLARRASARSAGVGHRSSHSSCTGSTRATGVCCSMNSETITDHGLASDRAPGQVARVLGVPVQDRGVQLGAVGTHVVVDATEPGVAPRSRACPV